GRGVAGFHTGLLTMCRQGVRRMQRRIAELMAWTSGPQSNLRVLLHRSAFPENRSRGEEYGIFHTARLFQDFASHKQGIPWIRGPASPTAFIMTFALSKATGEVPCFSKPEQTRPSVGRLAKPCDAGDLRMSPELENLQAHRFLLNRKREVGR